MSKIPETIEELKYAYQDKNLPPEEVTRFFIGKDYKLPRAFGIYKDDVTGNFVVYKNKADGVRAIRYEGKDEAYAVKQLYEKLEEEIINQKSNQDGAQDRVRKQIRFISIKSFWTIFLLFMTGIGLLIIPKLYELRPESGYYSYDNKYYYYQSGDWYGYDDDWSIEDYVPSELKKNHSDYYESDDYYSWYGISDFENSSYYERPSVSSSSSDYDSSSDYGSSWDSSDSWDSSSTDWDSDW